MMECKVYVHTRGDNELFNDVVVSCALLVKLKGCP